MVLIMRQCLIALDPVCLRSESLSKLGYNHGMHGARNVFVETLSKVGNQVNRSSCPLKSSGAQDILDILRDGERCVSRCTT